MANNYIKNFKVKVFRESYDDMAIETFELQSGECVGDLLIRILEWDEMLAGVIIIDERERINTEESL